jgi:hypothetical protein
MTQSALRHLLARPDELERVIDDLSWGDDTPLAHLSDGERAAARAELTQWALARAGASAAGPSPSM